MTTTRSRLAPTVKMGGAETKLKTASIYVAYLSWTVASDSMVNPTCSNLTLHMG
jgi:hypothetical protein